MSLLFVIQYFGVDDLIFLPIIPIILSFSDNRNQKIIRLDHNIDILFQQSMMTDLFMILKTYLNSILGFE
jgi:hypothetical protein